MLRGRGLSYAMAYKTNVRALWYRCARLFYVDSCSDSGCYLYLYRLGYPVSLFLPACCMVYLAYLFQKHQPPVRRKPKIYAGIFSGAEHDCFQNLRGKRPENTSAFSLSILQTENSCSTRKRKNPDYLSKMRTGVYQKILRADYLFLRYFGKMKFLSLSILF